MLVAGLVIGAVFAFLSPEFLTLASAGSILASAVQFGIVGLGITILMIAGEFDLSVASVYSLCPMVMASLWVNRPPQRLCLAGLAIALAVAIGVINGLATLMLRIPSFIITLATALFWAGVSLNLTGGYPISYFGDSPVMSWLGAAEIGRSKISVSILWLIAIAVILAAVLRMTAIGNWVFASGGDGRAARAMGVPVGTVKLACFVLSSLLARADRHHPVRLFRLGDADAGLRPRAHRDRRRGGRRRVADGRPRQHHGRPAGGDRARHVLHRPGAVRASRRPGSSLSSASCCCSP